MLFLTHRPQCLARTRFALLALGSGRLEGGNYSRRRGRRWQCGYRWRPLRFQTCSGKLYDLLGQLQPKLHPSIPVERNISVFWSAGSTRLEAKPAGNSADNDEHVGELLGGYDSKPGLSQAHDGLLLERQTVRAR